MSVELKRQSLLSKQKVKANTKGQQAYKAEQQKKVLDKQRLKAEKAELEAKKVKQIRFRLSVLGIILLMLIIVPKPNLLTYKKSNMVSQSIYWPGGFGSSARLLDSSFEVIVDKDLDRLYLCQDITKKSKCQEYKIIKRQGVFSVASYAYQHKLYTQVAI